MKKRPNQEKLIKERARKLTLHKCMVNEDWEENMMTNVIISRKHSNGNFTTCLYLVDLYCLGVKDTHYAFNIDKEEHSLLLEQAQNGVNMIEIDYNLAHNIIYAGYEFALDCGIKPHKDFEKTTKYMLEKDDENVPLIDIDCGNNGKPHYFQSEFENGTFTSKIIKTLEQNVGKGNFSVTLSNEVVEVENNEAFDEPENLEDSDLNIEEIAHEFIDYFNQEELSKDDEFKFSACLNILTNHYTDKERFEDIIELWQDDQEVEPAFRYEKDLSNKTITKIDDLNQKTNLSLADIDFLKKNFTNQALPDYIILSNNAPEPDPDDLDFKSKKFKAFNKKKQEFQKKYPDFPLFKLQGLIEKSSLEDLTIENIFKEGYALSVFELEEYLFQKLNALVRLNDITALVAFEYVLEGTAISDDLYKVLKESIQKIHPLLLCYRVINDFME